jgi:hypothetical protein
MSGIKSSAPGSTGVPESLLSFTVHSLPSPALEEHARRTATGRWKMLAVLAVCAAPVVASYFTYFVIRPQARSNYSALITPPREIPTSLSLRTLTGEQVAPESLRGQWLLVVVADAACDAACEERLFLQRQLRETLGRDKDRVDKVWLITDAGMPRTEVLQAISQGQSVRVLRVSREDLGKWLMPAEGHRLDEHFYIVDPLGQWMMRAPALTDPRKLKRDMDRLLNASASWDRPGR